MDRMKQFAKHRCEHTRVQDSNFSASEQLCHVLSPVDQVLIVKRYRRDAVIEQVLRCGTTSCCVCGAQTRQRNPQG